MKTRASIYAGWLVLAAMAPSDLFAAVIYLNDSNITVALGAGMAPEPFANRTAAASLASVIDAPTAAAAEFHNQGTHIWVNGGILELDFDFGMEYDLNTFHFWNYHSEAFDVDDIDLAFLDAGMNPVGTVLDVTPALGNSTGSDGSPIFAEDISLSFPSRVRFVNVVLSGTNNQVDFSNIGFTGSVSAVPEPASIGLLISALPGVVALRSRRRTRTRDPGQPT